MIFEFVRLDTHMKPDRDHRLVSSRTVAIVAGILIAAAPWQPDAGRSPAAASADQRAERPETIWDGVYTADQARRGQEIYNSECSYCHRDDLTGGFFDNGTGRAPALAGPDAFGSSLPDRWKNLAVGDMVADIASAMPQEKPASLTLQAYVDVVSYLFSKNGVPPGATELPTDIDMLGTLLIVPKPK
jgi:mono/diheme cytochrome c family protein